MAEAFESELERLVQRVASELARDITALILRRLGVEGSEGRAAPTRAPRAGTAPGRRRGRPARKAAAKQPARRPRATSEERAVMLAEVERAVNGSNGMSLGDLERETGMARSTLGNALKALKEEGRIFMGGTRRYARYASTQAAADRASLDARRGAAA